MNNNHCVYVGLGSNLGDSHLHIKTALIHLNNLPQTSVEAVSPLYQSKPWGGVDNQPDFLNAAAELNTQLSPEALLQHIKHIEYQLMGRVETERWHARVIDIDILLYDDVRIGTEELTIPHAHLFERCFVLKPLIDLPLKLDAQQIEAIQNALQQFNCDQELQRLEDS